MGLFNCLHILQEIMKELFNDLEYVRTYIDNLLIISNKSFENHINKLTFKKYLSLKKYTQSIPSKNCKIMMCED